ncbi:MAG: subclass B1 metallo-beta-lactamase [Tunicatimonas sp.]
MNSLTIYYLFALALGRLCCPAVAQTYASETLRVQPVSDRVYQHTSFLDTESFGRVPCNGMVVVSEGEAVIFDTPVSEAASSELIDWVADQLQCSVKAVVPTHFHQDCLAGLDEFHRRQIPSYGYRATIELAKKNGVTPPQRSFNEPLALSVGNQVVNVAFVGEGHTKDNVVGYFPAEDVLFGGCLVKEVGAGKGNLADANPSAWPVTIAQLQEQYPEAKVVIPGHGTPGGGELLEYTRTLFTPTE